MGWTCRHVLVFNLQTVSTHNVHEQTSTLEQPDLRIIPHRYFSCHNVPRNVQRSLTKTSPSAIDAANTSTTSSYLRGKRLSIQELQYTCMLYRDTHKLPVAVTTHVIFKFKFVRTPRPTLDSRTATRLLSSRLERYSSRMAAACWRLCCRTCSSLWRRSPRSISRRAASASAGLLYRRDPCLSSKVHTKANVQQNLKS